MADELYLCKTCNRRKPSGAFGIKKQNLNGLDTSRCNECKRDFARSDTTLYDIEKAKERENNLTKPYTCKCCGIEKPIEDFSWPNRKLGRSTPDTSKCKLCKAEARKQVTEALGKEAMKEISAAFWKRKPREKKLFDWAKLRAKQKGVPFDIAPEDVIIPDVCPVFGFPFEYNNPSKTASLDRIIPELGYVKGNIAVISMKANSMKNSGSTEDVGKLYQWLLSLETTDGLCRTDEERGSEFECKPFLPEM